MTNPDEKVDAMLRDMFGDDPAGAVMSQTKISTAPFSLDAPPVVKNTIPVNTGKPDFDLPEDNEPQSPFMENIMKLTHLLSSNLTQA